MGEEKEGAMLNDRETGRGGEESEDGFWIESRLATSFQQVTTFYKGISTL